MSRRFLCDRKPSNLALGGGSRQVSGTDRRGSRFERRGSSVVDGLRLLFGFDGQLPPFSSSAIRNPQSTGPQPAAVRAPSPTLRRHQNHPPPASGSTAPSIRLCPTGSPHDGCPTKALG